MCIASGFSTFEETSVICGFEINPDDIQNIETNSQYDKCLANDNTFKGKAFFIARLVKRGNSYKLEIYNQKKQSMIYKDEGTNFPFEYAKNKMVITSDPSHCYIVLEW